MGFLHHSIDDGHATVSFPTAPTPQAETIHDDLTLCIRCLNRNSVTEDVVSQSAACNMKKPVDAISSTTCRVEYMHKVLEQLPEAARAEAAKRCATNPTCSKLLNPAVHDIGLAIRKSGCSSTEIDMTDLDKCKQPAVETFRDCVRKIKSADDILDSKKCVPRSSTMSTDMLISVSVLYRPGSNKGSNFL